MMREELEKLAKTLVWVMAPGEDAQYYSPLAGTTRDTLGSFFGRRSNEPEVDSWHRVIFDSIPDPPDDWGSYDEFDDADRINAYRRESWQAGFDAKVRWVVERLTQALADAGPVEQLPATPALCRCGHEYDFICHDQHKTNVQKEVCNWYSHAYQPTATPALEALGKVRQAIICIPMQDGTEQDWRRLYDAVDALHKVLTAQTTRRDCSVDGCSLDERGYHSKEHPVLTRPAEPVLQYHEQCDHTAEWHDETGCKLCGCAARPEPAEPAHQGRCQCGHRDTSHHTVFSKEKAGFVHAGMCRGFKCDCTQFQPAPSNEVAEKGGE